MEQGKSTAMKALLGMLSLTSGSVEYSNEEISSMLPQNRINLGLAFVPQTNNVFTGMTVEENLEMGGFLRDDDIIHTINDVYDLFPILKEKRNQSAGELSGGQRQRVAIGRAITRNPKIFLFDEPLSNLDAALRAEMRVEISKLHNQIKTNMIYVTHDQVEAMTLADRIVILNQGNIEQVGTPEEIYNDPANTFVASAWSIANTGAKPVFVNTDPFKQNEPDFDDLISKIDDSVKGVIINSPSNPTGGVWSDDAISKLLKLSKEKDWIVISDETYEELVYDNEFKAIETLDSLVVKL